MNPRIKTLWLKDLRSRKFKQTTGQLKLADSFCCLGVLCNRYIKSEEGKKAKAHWEDDKFVSRTNQFGVDDVLPDEVILWAELEECDPILYKDKEKVISYGGSQVTGEASSLNDKLKYKFGQIAKLIERNL